jgi:transposase
VIEEVLALAAGNAASVGVAIEIPHGPVVQTLVDAGVKVFALNPKQLDRFRDRFTVAGAKDDRRDAHVLASALRTDRHAFWPVSLDSAEWAELREESRHYEELRVDFTRLTNRLRQMVGRCVAPLLRIGDVTEPWMWDILKR